jgi:hypothetical protein
MSLCQSETSAVSCGSCCGLFNLLLPVRDLRDLLTERTAEFQSTVDFAIRHSIPAFRQSREKKEANLPKKDTTTYNCPYLGYLDGSGRIGCMIHPSRTGDPKSQNYSFYGASICLGYECRNKERPKAKLWEIFFSRISVDSLEYSGYSANSILVRKIETVLEDSGIRLEEFLDGGSVQNQISSAKEFWVDLYQNYGFRNLTSFEVDYASAESAEDIKKEWEDLLGKDSPQLLWFYSILDT